MKGVEENPKHTSSRTSAQPKQISHTTSRNIKIHHFHDNLFAFYHYQPNYFIPTPQLITNSYYNLNRKWSIEIKSNHTSNRKSPPFSNRCSPTSSKAGPETSYPPHNPDLLPQEQHIKNGRNHLGPSLLIRPLGGREPQPPQRTKTQKGQQSLVHPPPRHLRVSLWKS